jgi:hypothetical protein
MNCDCGEKCFSYQKFNSNGNTRVITIVNKCSRLSNEKYANPKKKKCSFYSETIIKEDECLEKKTIKPELTKNNNKIHINELEKYISLYKTCIENGLNFKNFAARIDYHLDALDYNHFDYSKETIHELEKRIIGNPDRIKKFNKNKFIPIVSHELLPQIKRKIQIKKYNTVPKIKKCENGGNTDLWLDKMVKEESEHKEEIVVKKISVSHKDDCEDFETELKDHLEEEEENEDDTYKYKEGSANEEDDFSD